MKYETIVIIEKPISEVIKKLDNPENMKDWQSKLLMFNENINRTKK